MAEQYLPDIAGALRTGQAFGTQVRLQREDEARQAQLRGLAPQVIGGDPAALEQAAALDPEAAMRFQSVGDAQTRRLKGAIDYIDQAQKTGNPQAVEAAYQQVRPYLARFGQEPPATFAEAQPKFEEAKARIAMLAFSGTGNVQSTQILANGNIGIITRDGRLVDTGQAAAPSTQLISQPGEVPFLVTTGRGRVGQTTAIGQEAPPAVATGTGAAQTQVNIEGVDAQMQQRLANTVAFMAQQGFPKEQIDAWVETQLGGYSQQQQNGQAPITQGAPRPVRTPTAAETAAAETAAKQSTELQFLPTRLQMEAEGAGLQTAAQEQAKAEAARQEKEARKFRDAAEREQLLNAAEAILPQATGGAGPAAVDRMAATLGISTPGAQATARLNIIAAQLVQKVPRFEGPQSNIDVQSYERAAGDLANPDLPVQTRLAALRTMRSLDQKYTEKPSGGATRTIRYDARGNRLP